MIRGAFILALGFTLGYAKALQEQEDIRAGVSDAVASVKNFFEEAQQADSEMAGQDASGGYTVETEIDTPESRQAVIDDLPETPDTPEGE